VLVNFPGFGSADLLERMIELSMYTEEHLKYRPRTQRPCRLDGSLR
jgi:hypothetical protein